MLNGCQCVCVLRKRYTHSHSHGCRHAAMNQFIKCAHKCIGRCVLNNRIMMCCSCFIICTTNFKRKRYFKDKKKTKKKKEDELGKKMICSEPLGFIHIFRSISLKGFWVAIVGQQSITLQSKRSIDGSSFDWSCGRTSAKDPFDSVVFVRKERKKHHRYYFFCFLLSPFFLILGSRYFFSFKCSKDQVQHAESSMKWKIKYSMGTFFSCIHNGWVCIGESYDQFFKDAVWNIAYILMHTNSMMPSYQFGVSNSIKYRQC